MDKNELIEKIAGNTGLTKKDVGIVINTFIVTVTKALVEGSKVQLLGFGVFGTRERNARKVRNPRTGESIDLAASTVPYFKPGKILRDVVKSINHPIGIDKIQKLFAEEYPIYPEMVPDRVCVADARNKQVSIIEYAPESEPAQAYQAVCELFLREVGCYGSRSA